jgi:hypothetical protein
MRFSEIDAVPIEQADESRWRQQQFPLPIPPPQGGEQAEQGEREQAAARSLYGAYKVATLFQSNFYTPILTYGP